MATAGPRPRNTALSALLNEAGWQPANLACEVNKLGDKTRLNLTYDETSAYHWLAGTKPRSYARPLICEALSRRLGRPITLADAGLGPAQIDPEPGTDIVDALVDLGSADMDPTRRAVLGAAGLSSISLAIPGWEDVTDRLERLRNDPHTRIGMREVDAVRATTARLSDMDDEYGGRAARPLAAAYLVNTIAPYLRATASPKTRAAMLSAAADHCYLTGYMAADEGIAGVARRYYLRALELAGLADDRLSYCLALRGMSVQSVDLRSQDALPLADAAAAALPQADPRMRAFLRGQQAHATAQTRDHRKARTLLREAETELEKADSRPVFGRYSGAALHYHLSQILIEADDVKGSVAAMEQSTKLRPQTQRRMRVRTLGTLAERKVRLGRLEEACKDWKLMLQDYPAMQSGWCDQSYRTMLTTLAPHRKNPKAREVLEHARAVQPHHPG